MYARQGPVGDVSLLFPSLTALCSLVCGPAHAQSDAPTTTTLERVTITGTHVARSGIEGALPVQVVTREEIDRSGATSIEQVLERITAQVNGFNQALTVGEVTRPGLSSASLRGLGGGATLVLLNGRRLANYAFDGETVDLNSIPLAAVARIEVLKDGASAVYGTDAIAGVINFILRKDYRGAEVSGSFAATQRGSGDSGQLSASYGVGDPAREGYNLFASVTAQKDQRLRAIDRDFARTAFRPEEGINGLSGMTYPANIADRPNRRILNPTAAAGYTPPASLPFRPPPFFTQACGYDYAQAIDLLPEAERTSTMARGTWRVDAGLDLFAEGLIVRNRFDVQIAPTAVSPFTPFGNMTYPARGPFYPSEFAAANGLAGNLTLAYRTEELGPRRSSTTGDTKRFALGAEGSYSGWDFNVATVYSANRQENEFVSGFVYISKLVPAMATGLINPFGPSGPEGRALLASTAFTGTPQTAKGSTALLNAFASREFNVLPAGPLAIALGAEARHERLSYDWNPALLTGDPFLGVQPQSVRGDRNVYALFAELNAPIVRGLDAQLAVRHDDYSDFGATTNPKVALRWQAAPMFLVRGSWGRGFRAPPLYALNEPKTSQGPVGGVRDPVRCPITSALEDCFGVVETFAGGNPDLRAETSTQWNVGLVWDVARAFSIGVDYWDIEQRGVINPLDWQNIITYYDAFQARVIRGPVDPALPTLPGPIVAIDQSLINLGTTKTSGLDVTLNGSVQSRGYGSWRISLQGTHVRRWETQIDGVNFVSQLADATTGRPVPRWRSVLTIDWTRGPWGATLGHNYSGGYADQFLRSDGSTRRVGAFLTWDLQARFTGLRNWQLAIGIRNLFDADPPLSNQTRSFQIGFNPQAANPLGRVLYARAGYTLR